MLKHPEGAWTQIKHNGYGSAFNTLYISEDEQFCLKKTCSSAGIKKLLKEHTFLKLIQSLDIGFPIPRVYDDNGICDATSGNDQHFYAIKMEYMKGFVPLYTIFNTCDDMRQRLYVTYVQNCLSTLHASQKKHIDCDMYRKVLHQEMIFKVYVRYKEVHGILEPYTSYIKTIRGNPYDSFDAAMEKINIIMHRHISTVCHNNDTGHVHTLSLIHGDPQFHNILVRPDEGEAQDALVFIDPRGYFGDVDIFGIPEYDHAKVLLALSGYDIFDATEFDTLPIKGNDFHVHDACQLRDVILEAPLFVRALMVSIWLANAHCFKHKPCKAIYSFFYALYVAREFLD